jgi:signal transduction histidine kinase
MENQKGLVYSIVLGSLLVFVLIIIIILFVLISQRKLLLADKKIKQIEQDKQIQLFKATVEAEEKQKEKIARNLHDEINPILNSLKYNLSKYRVKAQKNTFDPTSTLQDEATLNTAIESIKTICHDLIPTFFIEFGLIPALDSFVKNIENTGIIKTEFQNSTTTELLDSFSYQEQLNVYRIILETLNNLIKHAACTFIKVLISSDDLHLSIEVYHNGKGASNEEMNAFSEKSNGLGLKSLNARLILLKAKINYQKKLPNPSIVITIPFNS